MKRYLGLVLVVMCLAGCTAIPDPIDPEGVTWRASVNHQDSRIPTTYVTKAKIDGKAYLIFNSYGGGLFVLPTENQAEAAK